MSTDQATSRRRAAARDTTPPDRSVKGAWLSHLARINTFAIAAGDTAAALTPNDIAVLVIVASYAGDGDMGSAYPSRAAIVNALTLSTASVDRSLAKLRKTGWLIVRRHGGTRKLPAGHPCSAGCARKAHVERWSTEYDVGAGPMPTPEVAPDDIRVTQDDPPLITGDKGAPITGDKGAPITGDNPSVPSDEVGPEEMFHPSPAAPAAAAAPLPDSAAPAAASAAPTETPINPRPKPRGKRDASRLEDLDNLMEWVSDNWGDDVVDRIGGRIEDMWMERRNWKAIARFVEKIENYPHGGDIPEPPTACQYHCNSDGQIEGARDRRDGSVRALDNGERAARWEDNVLIGCPNCRPGFRTSSFPQTA